jgi:hypothetical protein
MERLLDGKAPASAIAATITRAPGGGCPRSPGGCAPSARMRGSARSWLSPDRRLVHALPAGHGLFGPVRSCDAASGVLSRDPRQIRPLPCGRDRIPFASDRRTPRRRRLVKGHGPSLGQDAFHRRVLPPPVAPPAFAFSAWDHEEPATGLAARVLVAFATATRLPAPIRPRRSRGSQGARPLTFRSGPSAARRLLQPPQSASTPTRPPDPRPAQPERALARSARRPRCREARRHHRHARPKPRAMMTTPAPKSGGDVPSKPSPACSEHACAHLERVCVNLPVRSPVETSRARSALVRGPPLFPGAALAGDRRRVFSQPDPLGHLSSWNRRRAGWRLRPGKGNPVRGCAFGNPTQGRVARSSAKRTEIRRTRGAFHR